MTLILSPAFANALGWIGLLAALAAAIWVAAAVGRRDDGPPPDDMDEKPSP